MTTPQTTPTIPEEMRPQPGPQTAFLTTRADIAVYGGAAGGGKSWGILFECLRHVSNPRFGAVVFRRQSTQIKNEGGLWDEAGQMYPLVGGEQRVGDLEYRFPSGAKVSFRHLQHESTKFNWQGSQIPAIGFDELTHFSESQFFYMLSRNRSMCGIRPYIRATTNPDAGSWVKRFLGPWVDRSHPLFPTESGKILFMVRVKGKIQFYRTREACLAENPSARPKTVTFIRASVHDNKKLLEKDPDYLANLEAQGAVERARLLDGNWDIVNQGLVYPEFGTRVVEAEHWPAELQGKLVGGIDWGFADPFAAPLAVEDVDGHLWVYWTRYERRKTPTENSDALPRGEANNRPRWWADPAGASHVADFRRAGHDVISCTHQGQDPIKTGIGIVTQRIREGTISFHGNLADLIDEAGKYRYPEDKSGRKAETPIDKDNHLMDALRYLIVGNDRGKVIHYDEPEETEAQAIEREKVDAELAAKLEEEYRDPGNDHWWNGCST